MAIASNVALSRITGEYVDFQGNAIAGQVKFTLDDLQRNTFADEILVPSTASLTLDSNGQFTVDLPSTAETALTPSGFTYTVEESFSSGATYTISLPVINEIETRTNWVYNSSFENWTNPNQIRGWSAVTATFARVIDGVSGQFAIEMTSTTTASSFGMTSDNITGGRIPVTPGEVITVSAYGRRGLVGSRNLGMRLDFYETQADTTSVANTSTSITGSTSWSRISITNYTVPFNAYWLDIWLYASNTGAIGDTIRFDAVMVEKTSTLGEYFDGSVVPTGGGGERIISSATQSGANTIFTTSAQHNFTVGTNVYIRDINSGRWSIPNRTITAITPNTFTCATYAPGYVYFTGTPGHEATVPDSAALDITGDIDIRVKVAFDDWTRATGVNTENYFIGKWETSGNQRSWYIRVTTTGFISMNWSIDGTGVLPAFVSATSNVAISTIVADGAVKWIRVTLDVDNGSGGNTTRFWYSDDNVTYTELGTAQTQAGTTSIFNSTANLTIGSVISQSVLVAPGNYYEVEIYDGIAGTKVLGVDFANARVGLSSTFLASTGQTVTMTPTTSFDKAVISHFEGTEHYSRSFYPQYGGTYQIASLRPATTITNPQTALAYYPAWVNLENQVAALDVILDHTDTTFNPTPLQLQHLFPAHQTYDILATAYTDYADLANDTTVKITTADVSAVETLVEAQEALALADLADGETIDGQFIQPLMLFGN